MQSKKRRNRVRSSAALTLRYFHRTTTNPSDGSRGQEEKVNGSEFLGLLALSEVLLNHAGVTTNLAGAVESRN